MKTLSDDLFSKKEKMNVLLLKTLFKNIRTIKHAVCRIGENKTFENKVICLNKENFYLADYLND